MLSWAESHPAALVTEGEHPGHPWAYTEAGSCQRILFTRSPQPHCWEETFLGLWALLELQLTLIILCASVSHLEKEEEAGRLRLVQVSLRVQPKEGLPEWWPDSRTLH